jgi:hypothetical protein
MKHIPFFLSAAACLALVVACDNNDNTPEEPEQPAESALPEAAGALQCDAQNTCPDTTVTLAVGKITGAAAYVWYKNDTVVAQTPANTYTASTSGAYSVAGSNATGVGSKSATKQIHIVDCSVNVGAASAISSDNLQNQTNCALQNHPNVALRTSEIKDATEYVWYYAAGLDSLPREVQRMSLDSADVAAAAAHTATRSGYYYVAGAAKGKEGARSPHFNVTFDFSACTEEEVPRPSAPAWNTATTDNACVDSTITLSVASGTGASFDSRYIWFEKVGDVYVPIENLDSAAVINITKNVAGDYTFAVRLKTNNGVSDLSADKTITVQECNAEVAGVAWADIPDSAEYEVHDKATNGFTNRDNEHSITIRKGAVPNQLIITGLGGGEYAAGVITATFDQEAQTVTIAGGNVNGIVGNISYGAGATEFAGWKVYNDETHNPIWIGGGATTKELTEPFTITATDIVATIAEVDGKITLFLPADGGFTYQYWAQGLYVETFSIKYLGVDATLYGGAGTATVIQLEP